MTTPFSFGKIISGDEFLNREAERKQLYANFLGQINTILISPRRWGKSSLVKKTSEDALADRRDIRFCFIDLFSIRSEKEFYEELYKELVKSTSTRWEEWIQAGKKFLKGITPKFSMGVDPATEFSVELEWDTIKKHADEILQMPEKISKEKKVKIIICIDEFQNIEYFEQPLAFQKKLRSVWQKQPAVTYCLYGSKRHMLMDIFENKSMPFYKFGDLMMLQKIKRVHWLPYIIGHFKKTGKSINEKMAGKITDYMQCHPYFVQQFSQKVWLHTKTSVTDKVFEKALTDMLEQNAILYQRETDLLSNQQINFLKALGRGETQFSSSQVMRKYQLGASSTVTKVKQALQQKEVVDFFGDKPEFLDPTFELWFKMFYLKMHIF